MAAKPPDKRCTGCHERKPRSEFDVISMMTRSGYGADVERKHCQVCTGKFGEKPCGTCGQIKTIDKFPTDKHPSGLISYRRNCWSCVYAERKRRGTAAYREQKTRAPYGKRNRDELGPRKLASGVKPVGWTPPPTAEQLAAIHRRYQQPINFQRPRGEQCA
jgi:hypothetical protein